MELLYLLEKIRMPELDEFMLAITTLGEEMALLVIALILFWCVDKRHGYYILSVGFLGTIANQFMKLLFKVPRPWVKDPNFTIVEKAREGAGGFSFPSGHTQSAVGLLGGVAKVTRKKLLAFICVVGAVLVSFSRMYLGVHTPWDVLVGAAQSILLLMIIHPLVYKNDGKLIPVLLGGMIVIAAAFLWYVENANFGGMVVDGVVNENVESGIKNAYTLLGCTVGLMIVWIADRKLNFNINAVWWAQLLKVGLGLLVVLAFKEGLRVPLELICGGHMIARAIRYCLIVVVAGIVWPLTFRYFPKNTKVIT